jgi:LytR cell envelope-related transcriptional attenuator
MAAFSALVALVLIAAAVLTYVGVQTVRDSRAGKRVSTVTDPALPGFEAFLEPTPTMLVLHRSGATLHSAALLTLNASDAGGSVLLLPPATRINGEDDAATLDFVSAYGSSREDVVTAIQDLLGVGITEAVEVDDARWSELVAPVAPLALENPDAVGEFPAGELSLAPEQVGPYLAAQAEGESELARLFREQLFFEAWFDAVAASQDPDVVPGEVDSGIGRFIRGLAAGDNAVTTLPVTESATADGTRLDVDSVALPEVLAMVVPYPTASRPGQRIRIRLLDGTGDQEHVLRVAPLLGPAGGEVVVVGNADRFDYGATEIRLHNLGLHQAASDLQTELEAGEIIEDPRPTDAFDVTIVLGADV